ncbi:organic solvent tolerance protein [Pseudogulbenkiania sp. NH8B]|uniref:LPS-assembly protein LptD n=1 Tax=Pseudogulbenkiania sp. (strain NH8B) TaxID=748280 RepID=UPI000227920A|nr:LPS-assembly protein LptD [Pseudogulbenkiania sp. NH8B]BAK75161.1 organic solvent tolerance protein [Pseudogulbenkiania sp. NH8B]
MARLQPTPLTLALAAAFSLSSVQAEELNTAPAAGQTQLSADELSGQMDNEIKARGNVVVRRDDQTLTADWLEYYQAKNRARAGDHFTLTQSGSRVSGTQLDYDLANRTGTAEQPDFAAAEGLRTFRGNGERAEFLGRDKYRLLQARANTCSPGDDSWYLKASSIDLDYGSNVGEAHNARLEFQGVPILYTPWIDFPLDGGRKSGVLTPTFKTGSNGTELSIPYYWNIAPNYDATITPGYNDKRGAMLGAEFRYLQPDYQGEIATTQIPDDHEAGRSRYAWSAKHSQNLGSGFNLGYNANYVSDDDYFNDFGSRQDIASGTNLVREAWLGYGSEWDSGTFNAQLKAQRYQTLQESTTPVDVPYARLPQLTASANQELGAGLSANLQAELTRFTHPTKQEGSRLVSYPSVTWSLDQSWGYLRPKLGVHYTRYSLDNFGSEQAREVTRTLPIFSTDSGLYFERPTTLFGSNYIQTLEPRLYYLNIPSKQQNDLPNFDSAENSIDFAQLFNENRFSGSDRINGANQLTAALSTRYLDDKTGSEQLRLSVGQVFYFSRDNLTLDGTTSERSTQSSDLLFSAAGQLTPSWRFDSLYQHNQELSKTEQYNLQLFYTPTPGKTASIRYRYDRSTDVGSADGTPGPLRQVDIAGQWPLAKKWYAVARYNYSLQDKKPLEQLAGFEYNDGCWTARVVGQRYVSSSTATKNAVFLQLELKDLGGIGSNPLDTLRLAIPGYSKINDIRQ